MRPGPYFRWLQLQRCDGPTGVCVAAVSQPEAHSINCLSFRSIGIQSHQAEVFVEPSLAVVEKVRKMITKSGKSWGIYSKLQVTMEWMTVNLHVLLKFHPPAYNHKLKVISKVPWFAVSLSGVVCLFVCRDTLKWATADIPCLRDIKRKFFDRKVVWWWLSQHIAGILHETHAKYQVMRYGFRHYSEWNDCQTADFALFKLIKHTNLDIKDSSCLHVVHIFQHPTSRPTTRSTHITMVITPKKNISLLPAGKYGKSTKQSTCRHHQANEDKRGLEAERVPALGAMGSLRSKKKRLAEKRQETNLLSNEGQE